MNDGITNDDIWIRAGLNSTQPVWGLKAGIRVGIWPADVEGPGDGGPRGLLRIGFPIKDGGKTPGLLNFIAVEPIVRGNRGFSELEHSAKDQKPGLNIWSGTASHPFEAMDRGTVTRDAGVEHLRVTLFVERFRNSAGVTVDMAFRADRPGEVALTTHAAPESASMEYCVLTATMGNYIRMRRLWLNNGVVGVVEPRSLWKDHQGTGFTAEAFFPLDRLPRTASGDLLVCCTTDEAKPGAVAVDARAPWWRYRGDFPVTQYWRMRAGGFGRDTRVRVNGRSVYWANHTPIPGGLAYENFDLMEPFHDGQTFIFGVSRKEPLALLGKAPRPRGREDQG